ncbi:MAG: hypothetical protein ACI8TF_000793 [Paracoccaceae bacterium]|jgi:hypothetical protein
MGNQVLTKTRLTTGRYEGILSGSSRVPIIEVVHMDRVIGIAQTVAIEAKPDQFLVSYALPPEVLSDGMQIVVLRSAADATPLDVIAILAGEPLEQDLRAEIALMRVELDMFKRAFRRHCVETGED